MKKNSMFFFIGHRGLVGSAIWKSLENKGETAKTAILTPSKALIIK